MGQDAFIHETAPANINTPQGENLTIFRKVGIVRNPPDAAAPFQVVHPDGYIEPLATAAGGAGVQSVTGYNVDNIDPANPIILPVEVDGVTITGTGVVGDPFVATQSGVESVTGYNVDNTDPVNPVILPVEVDGVTITGSGVVGDPFVANITTNAWLLDGNNIGVKRTLGSIDNFDIGFITNNTERMTIDKDGQVGVGGILDTISKFQVHGTTDDGLTIIESWWSAAGNMLGQIYSNTATSASFTLNVSGNGTIIRAKNVANVTNTLELIDSANVNTFVHSRLGETYMSGIVGIGFAPTPGIKVYINTFSALSTDHALLIEGPPAGFLRLFSVRNNGWIQAPQIPAFADNTAAFAAMGAGFLYYTDTAGEYIIKLSHV